MVNKKLYLFFLCLFLLLSVSGCWDLVEVDRRAFITTIGIDVTEQGETELTVQVPLPQRILPVSIPGGQPGKRFYTVNVTGPTVYAAFNALQSKTYRELVLEQNKSVIISEEAAQQGVKPLLDVFLRSPKAPPQTLVFIAQNHKAREIISFSPIQEILPGMQFIQSAQSTIKYDRTYYIPMWEFQQKMVHRSTDTFAPLIDLDRENKVYQQGGLAVFNGDHMTGKLDSGEAQIFGLISGLMQAGNMTFELPGIGKITMENVKGKSKVDASAPKGGLPSFRFKTIFSGSLVELNLPPGFTLTPSAIRQLEGAIRKVLQQQMVKVVQKLKHLNSDIIDFGETLRVQQPQIWKKLQWKQVFIKVPFGIDLQVKIQRDGVVL